MRQACQLRNRRRPRRGAPRRDCAACRAPSPNTCRARRSCTRRQLYLPGLWRRHAQARRRRLRDARLRAGILQGARHVRPEALLRTLCPGDPAAGALAPDRARYRGAWTAGAGDRGQVRRPLPAVSAAGDLPALRRGTRSRDTGRLGRWGIAPAGTPGRGARPVCAGGREAARRRYAGAGARPRARQDQDRATMDLRAR